MGKKKEKTAKSLSWKKWAYIIIAAYAFMLYGNTIPNNYSLDDIYVTGENPQIEKGISGIPEIFTSLYANVKADDGSDMSFGYRPIVKTTFAIEHELFEKAPHISHFLNIILYVLVLLVLFNLLRKLLKDYSKLFPLLIVLIFAAHPVHTEVVASLKNRDELMAFLFSFLALGAFLKYYDYRQTKQLIYGLLLFLLAYLSKASAMVYLAVFPLVLYFFREVNVKRLLLVTAGALIVVILARFLPRMLFLPSPDRLTLFFENPLLFEENKWLHISTGFSVLLFYLGKLVFPHPLLFYYGYNEIPVVNFAQPEVIISIVIHLALLVIAFYYIRRKKLVSFAILFYFITISIYANMVKPVMGIVGERFLFAPVLAFSIVAALLIYRITKTKLYHKYISEGKRYTLIGLALILLVPYTVKTIARNTDWKDQLTLTGSDISHLDKSAKANFLYGLSLKNDVVSNQTYMKKEGQPKIQLMIKHFRRAIEIYPEYYQAWNQLGEIYMVVKDNYDMADRIFRKALSINPELQKAYYNLGYLNYKNQKYELAKKYYKQYLDFQPEHVGVHSMLSKMAFRQDSLEKALEWNRKILEFNPENAEAYFNMGNFQLQNGDTTVAVENFEKAAQLNPRNKQLNKNLYRHFKKKGNMEKANYYLNLEPKEED